MTFLNDWHPATVLVLFCLLPGLSSCEAGRDAEERTSTEVGTGAAGEPGAGAGVESERAVVGEALPYAEVADQLVYGYFAFPADMVEPLPAVILLHDRWGLDASIRDLSGRLAAQGYIVMAIDLFGGEVAETPGPARELEIKVFENPQLAAENIRKAYQFVKDTLGAPRIASLGFGFGGGWSLNAAMLLPNELEASIIYYGQVTDDQRKLAAVRAPILGLFAGKDRVIPGKSVLAFQLALQALEKEFEIETFAGAGRGFADPRSKNYDTETAEIAWQHVMDFLAHHLATDS